MKVRILHDAQGNIKSLMVPGPDFTGTSGITSGREEEVSVVERPDLEGEQLHKHLRELYEEFRVDASSDTPRLVRK